MVISKKFDIAAMTLTFMVFIASAQKIIPYLPANCPKDVNGENPNQFDPPPQPVGCNDKFSLTMTDENRCLNATNGGCYAPCSQGPIGSLLFLSNNDGRDFKARDGPDDPDDPGDLTVCYGWKTSNCSMGAAGTNDDVAYSNAPFHCGNFKAGIQSIMCYQQNTCFN
jgi:hypothetical protein